MNRKQADDHLSGISTHWTVLRNAHGAGEASVTSSQAQLLHRYRSAINKYVYAFVRNRDSAEEICQDFAVRFLRGDFRNADPSLGRFRDLVKSSVYNLIIDYIRRRDASPKFLPESALSPPSVPPAEFESDREFIFRWRAELLNRAWESLREYRPGGRRLYEVLLARVTFPKSHSDELAACVSEKLGEIMSPDVLRQALRRARERFAELLIEEVERTLETGDLDRVERELIDLDLLSYCKPALRRRVEPVGVPA